MSGLPGIADLVRGKRALTERRPAARSRGKRVPRPHWAGKFLNGRVTIGRSFAICRSIARLSFFKRSVPVAGTIGESPGAI